MVQVSGKGYAKIILFGEHFVVYGLPGIASGLDKFVEVKAEKLKDSKEVIFDDKVFKEKFSMNENPEHIKSKLVKAMFGDEQFVKLEGIKFVIDANFSPKSGMGYSAALCVAFARAINALQELGWKDEKINQIAYKGEKVSHGNPSGIDNTCATYGSLVWFKKDLAGKEDTIQPFKCGKKLLLVIADTGVKHDTKKAVEFVAKQKEADPKKFEKLFAKEKKILSQAKTELKFGDLNQVGKLMNENQELLREIGVSIPEAERIIKLANYEGALGAKITGAGLGGKVIILCPTETQQEKVISILARENFKSEKAIIS